MSIVRIFSISDLHTDYKRNFNWVKNLSKTSFLNDFLILPGDINHKTDGFKQTLELLSEKFSGIFFVPGNHDLWVDDDSQSDSLQKYFQIEEICKEYGVFTKGQKVGNEENSVFVQPIHSWYEKPEESADSLYYSKRGDDPSLPMWVDNHYIKWPEPMKKTIETIFKMNNITEAINSGLPVISFSHFLPLQKIILPKGFELSMLDTFIDPFPKFNFSRVAGSLKIERLIRNLNSKLHIFGHQHRFRYRVIDGVSYLSHGLYNPRERDDSHIADETFLPKLVWTSKMTFINYKER